MLPQAGLYCRIYEKYRIKLAMVFNRASLPTAPLVAFHLKEPIIVPIPGSSMSATISDLPVYCVPYRAYFSNHLRQPALRLETDHQATGSYKQHLDACSLRLDLSSSTINIVVWCPIFHDEVLVALTPAVYGSDIHVWGSASKYIFTVLIIVHTGTSQRLLARCLALTIESLTIHADFATPTFLFLPIWFAAGSH